ncbi:3-ketoacyl-ACP reductase [Humitalea sp. 24SJ18S-53]|uniref:3-ketoacyl-ACP reductase n=1 Tax=Humitalea sp. 24SJ18S-53 TaxID=3422307 RepID=UPI003D67358D
MADRAPVALVTGGRRGIGRGICLALAAEGFDVVVADLGRDADADETMAAIMALGRRAAWLTADIADVDGHAGIAAAAFGAFGTLDCLVNNAGVQVAVRGDLLDTSAESFDRLMGVNLRGTFFLTQAIARRMLAEERGDDATPRSIVTITSANAFIPAPDRAEYCFSKSALSMMVKVLALRLAPHGIAAHEVRPGIIRTAMTAPAASAHGARIASGVVPARRWGEPEDVGRVVATLAAGRMPFSTGDAFHVDGGLHLPSI